LDCQKVQGQQYLCSHRAQGRKIPRPDYGSGHQFRALTKIEDLRLNNFSARLTIQTSLRFKKKEFLQPTLSLLMFKAEKLAKNK
jgi:hypothetical protein